MTNIFSEDALIEQPAIRLFKDGLGWGDRPRIRPRMHELSVARSFIREKFVDGSLCDKITP